MREINSLAREFKSVFGWHQACLVLLSQFVIALIKVRSVNLTRIAQVFYGDAEVASNYKRLQRFLKGFKGIKVGVGFQSQLIDSVPSEDHDERVDYIVTDKLWWTVKS